MYECVGSGYDCIFTAKHTLKLKNKVQSTK